MPIRCAVGSSLWWGLPDCRAVACREGAALDQAALGHACGRKARWPAHSALQHGAAEERGVSLSCRLEDTAVWDSHSQLGGRRTARNRANAKDKPLGVSDSPHASTRRLPISPRRTQCNYVQPTSAQAPSRASTQHGPRQTDTPHRSATVIYTHRVLRSLPREQRELTLTCYSVLSARAQYIVRGAEKVQLAPCACV